MKEVARIEVSDTPVINEERVRIYLNRQQRGEYRVLRHESVVENALLLLGFAAVVLSGEGRREQRFEYASLISDDASRYENRIPDGQVATRGEIRLVRRWSEPLEEFRLEVFVNDEHLGGVASGMGVKTLRAIVALLGAKVEVQLPARLAA